jgi:uncharacterized surface protein with fasciclin (FAS1) repeats
MMKAIFAFAFAAVSPINAFAPTPVTSIAASSRTNNKNSASTTFILRDKDDKSPQDGGDSILTIQNFLKENYPLFESLLLTKIPNIYDTLRVSDSSSGFTIFCPSNSVMEGIDSKRKVQISDPRNLEVTEKLASYHVIANGKVTQERLKREDWTKPPVDGVAALSIGGVLTLAGETRVGRSKSGGFLGWGAKEDGGVVIGNNEARVVKSTTVGNGVVHEVDGFVAPDLIWRYFDQLQIRIPGL